MRILIIKKNVLKFLFTANIAVCRSYLSEATRLDERTGAVSMISLAQVLGFIIGPALQAAVTFFGDDGYRPIPWVVLNMYTASGWINVIMSIMNFIFFLSFMFQVRFSKFQFLFFIKLLVNSVLLKTFIICKQNFSRNIK